MSACIDCGKPRSSKSLARCRRCHDLATRRFAAASIAYIAPVRSESWCEQCERRVLAAEAARCGSQWCKVRVAA
jgi:hypothetical protein